MSPAAEGWDVFFRPGARVIALPSWKHPRLLLPADTVRERASGSAFYPAFRMRGRVYRWLLRLRALAAIDAGRSAGDSPPLLAAFLEDALPGAKVRAVQVGMPGRTSKLTAQLMDDAGCVVAYLKCAYQAVARQRLRSEYDLLRQLPPGAGPMPLKYSSFSACDFLLMAAIHGVTVRVAAAPPPALRRFCGSLLRTSSRELEAHPWVRAHAAWNGDSIRLLEMLRGREWPMAIQHGDLAPWNLIRGVTGAVSAIDWEYGSTAGFPGLDLAHYMLQVALLVRRSKPTAALTFAVAQLTSDRELAPSRREAAALVGLAARQAFEQGALTGHSPAFWAQAWRRAVWERAANA